MTRPWNAWQEKKSDRSAKLLPINFEKKKVNTLYIYIPFECPLAFAKIRQRTNEVAAMKASALAPKAALHRERYLETRSNWK